MTTVLTANIRVTLPRDVAGRIFDHLLAATSPDFGGLQEWGAPRNPILNHTCRKHGYRWTRPKGCGPVVWDDKRYRLVKARARVLARRGFMGRLPGRRSTLPDSLAAMVILANSYGHEMCVINAHLTAEVQDRHGDYHSDSAHRARVRRHKREVKSLANIARRQRRKGREVYVVGDGNFDGLNIPGLISCWVGREDFGTLGNRTVDGVWATSFAESVRTIRNPSDHDAVAATY